MLKKKHLTFALQASAPPPPLISGATAAAPKAKKKPILQTAAAAITKPLAKLKKRPREEGAHEGQKPKKKRPAVAEAAASPNMKVAPPMAESSSSSTAGAAAASAIGSEPAHVLLLLGLPLSLTERTLELHFARCAPLQVRQLRDWASGAPRGAACLAVGSSRAAKLALGAEMASVGGVRIRVCGHTDSATDEMSGFGSSASAEMRTRMRALIDRASAAAGSPLAQQPEASAARHLLLACDAATAAAAVDEFCAVMRSGKPKSPYSLLVQTLLRQRRLAGGAVWRGRVNGLPLPREPMERLRALLDRLDWSSTPAEGKLRGAMADQSFKLGLSTKEWGKNNGPYAPFAFMAGFGMWDAASVTRRHRDLWEAAGDLIRAADPSYAWTSVQFNKNFRGSRHRDDKDAMHQVATAFGEYTGGELRVYGQDGIMDVNTRNRFVRFDGRYEHEVLPYEGTRYSVIFFALAPPFAVDPASTEEGIGGR